MGQTYEIKCGTKNQRQGGKDEDNQDLSNPSKRVRFDNETNSATTAESKTASKLYAYSTVMQEEEIHCDDKSAAAEQTDMVEDNLTDADPKLTILTGEDMQIKMTLNTLISRIKNGKCQVDLKNHKLLKLEWDRLPKSDFRNQMTALLKEAEHSQVVIFIHDIKLLSSSGCVGEIMEEFVSAMEVGMLKCIGVDLEGNFIHWASTNLLQYVDRVECKGKVQKVGAPEESPSSDDESFDDSVDEEIDSDDEPLHYEMGRDIRAEKIKEKEKKVETIMLLVGPPGSGKTHFAKEYIHCRYGGARALVELDCKACTGTDWSKAVVQPGCISIRAVLFKNCEDFSKEAMNMLIQARKGEVDIELQDAMIDWKEVECIMSTTKGCKSLFDDDMDPSCPDDVEALDAGVARQVPSSVWNLATETRYFKPKGKDEYEEILTSFLSTAEANDTRLLKYDVTDAAKEYLCDRCYSLEKGCHPLISAIKTEIIEVAEDLLRHKHVSVGQTIKIDYDDTMKQLILKGTYGVNLPQAAFTDLADEAINKAYCIAVEAKGNHLDPLHLALALLSEEANEVPPTSLMLDSSLDERSDEGRSMFRQCLSEINIDADKIKDKLQKAMEGLVPISSFNKVTYSEEVAEVIREAKGIMKKSEDTYIARPHLLLALVQHPKISRLLEEISLTAMDQLLPRIANRFEGLGEHRHKSEKSAIDSTFFRKYCPNMVTTVEQKQMLPKHWHDDTVQVIIEAITGRQKKSVVLVGEDGILERDIAISLADYIAREIFPGLAGVRLLLFDWHNLTEGCEEEEVENRVKLILRGVERDTKEGRIVIFYIPHLHWIFQDDLYRSAIILFRQAISRGSVTCLGSTSSDQFSILDWQILATKAIFLEDPNDDLIKKILQDEMKDLQQELGVKMEESVIHLCIRLTERYLPHRAVLHRNIEIVHLASLEAARVQLQRGQLRFLNRRCDHLDESIKSSDSRQDEPFHVDLMKKERAVRGEAVRIAKERSQSTKKEMSDLNWKWNCRSWQEKGEDAAQVEERRALENANLWGIASHVPKLSVHRNVTDTCLAKVMAELTRLPIHSLLGLRQQDLIKYKEDLVNYMPGQALAAEALNNAVDMTCGVIVKPKRTTASLLLLGPSGSGKTYSVIELADLRDISLISIDCRNLSANDTMAELIAKESSSGLDQPILLSEIYRIRSEQFQIVLIQHIEELSKSDLNWWCKVLKSGSIYFPQGKIISLCNTLVVFTSNLGSNSSSLFSCRQADLTVERKGEILRRASEATSDDFIDEVGQKIIFNKLTKEFIYRIIDRYASLWVAINLNVKGHSFFIDGMAKEQICSEIEESGKGLHTMQQIIDEIVVNTVLPTYSVGDIVPTMPLTISYDNVRRRFFVSSPDNKYSELRFQNSM